MTTNLPNIPVAVTVAGSDSSGGAGLQADLKTFHHFGVYGASVVTLLTAQNSRGVWAIQTLQPQFVLAQWDAVTEEFLPQAVKTGALGTPEIITAVADRLQALSCPLVVDPVILSKSGSPLLDEDGVRAMRDLLFPLATLLTPNLREAELLTGTSISDLRALEKAAATIAQWGSRHVLVKGPGVDGEAVDVLFSDGRFVWFHRELVPQAQTHGSGCVFSAAITALLAQGKELVEAIDVAKSFVTHALQQAAAVASGFQPMNLHVPIPPGERRA